jgi:DNA-directed RNA polymerase subunit RPC12/RpoP
MKNLKLYEEWLSEKKPAGAPEWKDSDAPDAEGRFKELGIKDLAAWLIKTRKKDLKKISGSITQQIVFNRKKDPEYAEKMEKVRQEVYKQLGREDLMESIKDGVIKCDNCDWKWDIVTGGDDPYDCHKCGHSNEPLSEKEDLYEAKIGVADPSIDVSQIV